MTNTEFSQKDKTFKEACAKVGLPKHVAVIRERSSTTRGAAYPSLARQASKWRHSKGLAYKEGRF